MSGFVFIYKINTSYYEQIWYWAWKLWTGYLLNTKVINKLHIKHKNYEHFLFECLCNSAYNMITKCEAGCTVLESIVSVNKAYFYVPSNCIYSTSALCFILSKICYIVKFIYNLLWRCSS